MALIEKGLYQQEEHGKPTSPTSLAQKVLGWGLVLTGLGVALVIASVWTGDPDAMQGGLVFGFIGGSAVDLLCGHKGANNSLVWPKGSFSQSLFYQTDATAPCDGIGNTITL